MGIKCYYQEIKEKSLLLQHIKKSYNLLLILLVSEWWESKMPCLSQYPIFHQRKNNIPKEAVKLEDIIPLVLIEVCYCLSL